MNKRRRIIMQGLRALILGLLLIWGAERGAAWLWPMPMDSLDPIYSPPSLIVDREGRWLRVLTDDSGERCVPVTQDEISPWLIDALISAEDQRFYEHGGVDLLALTRALHSNTRRGRVVSGASTLTMQLVRMLEARPRTYQSKAIEAFRARQLEREHSKDEILLAYLNRAPFGGTIRGVGLASWRWFGKPAQELDAGEAATLVAMLPAPSARRPDRAGERLRKARNQVLDAMERCGKITRERAEEEREAPLKARYHDWPFRAPHACDRLPLDAATESGRIVSEIDLNTQSALEEALRRSDNFGVDGLAAVVLERKTGAVEAYLGSRNYLRHPLDAAACRRSAGSTLKPFLYALALEEGLIQSESSVEDRARRWGSYAPGNFSGQHRGFEGARLALARSSNGPALRLLERLGPARFRDRLLELGIDGGHEALQLDLALGSLEVSSLELAKAYRRFVDGEVGSEAARRWVKASLRRPLPGQVAESVSWKSGTSSGQRDAWCVGYDDRRVIVVWLGRLAGGGAAELVGGESAGRLLGEVFASLPH